MKINGKEFLRQHNETMEMIWRIKKAAEKFCKSCRAEKKPRGGRREE